MAIVSVFMYSIYLAPLVASIIFGANKVSAIFPLQCKFGLELRSQEVPDTFVVLAKKVQPRGSFYRLISPRRRSPVKQGASNAHREVFDDERMASADNVLDIRRETKMTDEGLAL
jgi:hypothetical protein